MKRLPVLFFLLLPLALSGQRASLREETVTMKTYMFSDPDPVPNIGRIYPWFRFDGFTAHPAEKTWKMVVLENPYIKVYVCPAIGGKVWGAIEKSTGGAFLYYNHVVKFRDVGMRGPWTSGGLEYNFGDIGHIPTGATPVDYVTRENDDGSVSCTVGAIDLPSRTRWSVEIRLEPDKAYFETRTVWVNNTPLPNTYYHWMNAAAKAAGNLHFIYPGDYYIGHGGEYGSWPVQNGRDLSWYENNDFGSSKSYHVINAYTNFFGGYWVDDDFGFGHMSRYDDKPGKKLWLWALSRQGMIWEDLLTDDDGQYIEFQAGKLFNQAAYSSTFTPFKHKEFPAGDADVMTDRWFPLVHTGGMVAATRYAVLNVQERAGKAHITVSALQPLDDTLCVSVDGKVVMQKALRLEPLQLDRLAVDKHAGEICRITLGGNKLVWSSDTASRIVDRPVKPDPAFDWETAYGRYIRGLESEKQRRYQEAQAFYAQALAKEPGFAPALGRQALLLYRQMKYHGARDTARKALAIDTYDPLANYVFGLSCQQLGEKANARSGFGIAAGDISFRPAAYTELARSYMLDKNYAEALHYTQKALAYNAYNLSALGMAAVVWRKTHNRAAAMEMLDKLEAIDPTLHLVLSEKWLWGEIPKETFLSSFKNELPAQYFLELALFYYDLGLPEEAGKVLAFAPESPLILLWQAFLDKDHRDAYMRKVTAAPVAMVFPYREETARILRELAGEYDSWKLKYYLALIYWSKDRTEEARQLFTECGTAAGEVPFWLARARLFNGVDSVVWQSLSKARDLDPSDWRAALAYMRYHIDRHQARQVLSLAAAFADKYPEQPALGLTYAKALIQTGNYRKCIAFLDHYKVLPFEGAAEGHSLYHRACVEEALALMDQKKYRPAMTVLQKATAWPENLGAGQPFDVDERMVDYLMALALKRSGKKKEAADKLEKVAAFRSPDRRSENSKLIFQLWALEGLGQKERAVALLEDEIHKAPGNPYLQWVAAMYRGDKTLAEKTETTILKNRTEENPYDVSFRDRDFEWVTAICRRMSGWR